MSKWTGQQKSIRHPHYIQQIYTLLYRISQNVQLFACYVFYFDVSRYNVNTNCERCSVQFQGFCCLKINTSIAL
jgi:hypothetical protein